MAARGSSSPSRKKVKTVEEEDAGGFRFTRGSRRAKVKYSYYHGGHKSAKKKRRSSFVRGRKERKSLVQPETLGVELYREIPSELPQEARLRKLFDGCLQLALDKLDSDGRINVPDLPDFQAEAKEVLNNLRCVISDSDIIDEAFQTPKEEVKLKSEGDKWDKLLSDYQEEEKIAENTLRKSQEVNNNECEECPDFLSPEQHELLSGKPSFKGLFEKHLQLHQQIALQVHDVCKVTNTLGQYHEKSQAFIEKQLASFSSKALADEVATPRRLIRGQLKRT